MKEQKIKLVDKPTLDPKKYYEALLASGAVMTAEQLLGKVYEEEERVLTHTEIDKLCGGIPKSALTIIAGSTGNGKSLSSIITAYHLALDSTVIFVSCENRERTDQKRIKALNEKYGPRDKFFYYNVKRVVEKEKSIMSLLECGEFDIVVIDGMQFILDSGRNGSESKAIGEKLVKQMIADINYNENKPTVVLSWQLNREGNKLDLSDLTPAHIAMSMDVSTACEQMFAVKKIKKTKDICMASIKNRDTDEDSMNTIQLTHGGKITLKVLD